MWPCQGSSFRDFVHSCPPEYYPGSADSFHTLILPRQLLVFLYTISKVKISMDGGLTLRTRAAALKSSLQA